MLRGESMAGRGACARPETTGSLASTGMCGRHETGQARLYGNGLDETEMGWTKCAVEMRLAASGSGESAYF